MDFDDLKELAHCCACGGDLDRVNIQEVNYRAKWASPKMHNVLTGEGNYAIAVICDQCAMMGKAPVEVIEFVWGGGPKRVRYHAVENLQPIKPYRSYRIFTTNDTPPQTGIECLRCKRLSYNANDVRYKYCGFCNRFHEEE